MKVWYKLVLEDKWLVGYLIEDDSFWGGWKIKCDDGVSTSAISLVEDFKMYKI